MDNAFVAMLALSKPEIPSAEAIIAEFKRRVPKLPFELEAVDAPEEGTEVGRVRAFTAGDRLLSVMLIDKPLPAGMLDAAIQADLVWPEAKEKLAAHEAHIIVGCVAGSEGYGPAIDTAGLVTAMAAVVAALTPTIGVYWSSGNTVTETSQFQRVADSFFAGNPPVTVWVQLLLLPSLPSAQGEPTLAAVTQGLQPFVGREIEFQPSTLPPVTVAQKVVGACIYLLSKGPVLKDGDTLGISEEERIRVAYADQGHRPGIPVMKLSLERLDDMGAVAGGPGGSGPAG